MTIGFVDEKNDNWASYFTTCIWLKKFYTVEWFAENQNLTLWKIIIKFVSKMGLAILVEKYSAVSY